jgi:hypothetical protein
MRVELVRRRYELTVGRVSTAESSRCSRNWSGRSGAGVRGHSEQIGHIPSTVDSRTLVNDTAI